MRYALLIAVVAIAPPVEAQGTSQTPSSELQMDFTLDPEPGDAATAIRRRMRRSRAVLTTGALLLGMGAVHLTAWGSSAYCTDRGNPTKPTRSRWMGGLMMGLGFGLTFGGTVSLLMLPSEQREATPMTPGGRRGFRRGVVGTALSMLLVSLTVGFVDYFDCTAT